jgi:hypothetical protein
MRSDSCADSDCGELAELRSGGTQDVAHLCFLLSNRGVLHPFFPQVLVGAKAYYGEHS